MSRVGVWTVTGDGPRRMASVSLDFEQRLEAWIGRDPSLLEPGLTNRGLGGTRVQPDAILSHAQGSTAPALRKLVDVAQRHSLVARPWKNCVMLSPPRHRGRALITVWPAPQPGGRVKVYLSPETFAQFFPVTEEQVRAVFQQSGGSRLLDAPAIETLATSLPDLLGKVAEGDT